VVGEDNAAYEKVFCCQAVVFCAPLDSDAVEVEGGERGERGRMGVRMRIVIEGEVGERGGEEGGEKEEGEGGRECEDAGGSGGGFIQGGEEVTMIR
jgi:hypothetical protein